MTYYVVNPETGDKEAVGETGPDWRWIVDPRAVRDNEEIVDETGKTFLLSDFIKPPD